MPPGGPDTVMALADGYNTSYFILEPGGILEEYREIYQQFDVKSGLEFLGEVEDARIYALQLAE